MEVKILSRETIKPSNLHNLKPQNLCVFDQLTPNTYPEVVLFYSITQPNFNLSKTLANLKKSLSETLAIFYPFSGRTRDNLYTDGFSAGVPFLEARLNRRLAEYFSELSKNLEPLNQLVPCKPFRRETDSSGPQIAFQVTAFACGGIALGTSVCHKKSDGATLAHFLHTWAAIYSDSPHKIVPPNLSEAASLFPPLREVPKNALSLMDEMWFKRSNYVTRRFFFGSKAVDGLKALARSENVPTPTRNEAISCFIWKHAMAAGWAVSGAPRTSIAAHAVNIRPRMKPPALESCPGNLFWWAAVAANPAASEAELGLAELVALTREVMAEFDGGDYLETMAGEGGFEPIAEFLNQLEAMLAAESEKPDIFGFTNWKGFFNAVDFGWGRPVWVAPHGKVGDEFRNLMILVDKQGSDKEIEAFLTLEEKQMAVLESDEKFLAFASVTDIVLVSSEIINSSRL